MNTDLIDARLNKAYNLSLEIIHNSKYNRYLTKMLPIIVLDMLNNPSNWDNKPRTMSEIATIFKYSEPSLFRMLSNHKRREGNNNASKD